MTVTYFEEDLRKDGGAFRTVSGIVRSLDRVRKILRMEDRTMIPFDDIVNLSVFLKNGDHENYQKCIEIIAEAMADAYYYNTIEIVER